MVGSIRVNMAPLTSLDLILSSNYHMSRSGSSYNLDSSASVADEARDSSTASTSAFTVASSCTSTFVSASSAVLQDSDVVCGRSNLSHSHPGNKRYHRLIQAHAKQYCGTSKREVKLMLTNLIISQVESEGGRFLKPDEVTGELHEVRRDHSKPFGDVGVAVVAGRD